MWDGVRLRKLKTGTLQVSYNRKYFFGKKKPDKYMPCMVCGRFLRRRAGNCYGCGDCNVFYRPQPRRRRRVSR